MERNQDHYSERERVARVLLAPGPRPAPPGQRPSAWTRREPPRPAPTHESQASVEAYYGDPSLRHAPSFY